MDIVTTHLYELLDTNINEKFFDEFKSSNLNENDIQKKLYKSLYGQK